MFSENLILKLVDFVTNKNNSFTSTEEELVNIYLNDVNSSKVREYITAHIAGYKSINSKHGRDCFDPRTNEEKEIKPIMYTNKALNGRSNISDYSRARFDKDVADNISFVHSAFAFNKLLYIVEFSFDAVKDKLNNQITLKCIAHNQRYVRSANWIWSDWIDHSSLKFIYFDINLIKSNPTIFNKKFLNKLIKKYSLSS